MDLTLIIGFAAGAIMTSSSAPQILRALRSKSTRDISPVLFLLTTLGSGAWWLYGYLRMDPAMLVWNGVAFALNGAMLLLTFKYSGFKLGDHV